MSTKSDQHISQLMDGELEQDCSRFLLKRLQSDAKLKQKWQNYHLLRNALQQNQAPLMVGLSAKVGQQLRAQQQNVAAGQPPSNHSWSKALLGSAIAASVALVAIFSLTVQNSEPLTNLPKQANYTKTSAQLIAPPTAYAARAEQPIGMLSRSHFTPEVQQYIIESNGNHGEHQPYYYSAEYLKRLQKERQQSAHTLQSVPVTD